METIVELLKLAGVGVVAAWFTSRLANQDYRHRKWWELRVAAYQNAIDALSDIVYYYGKHYTAEIESRDMPKDFKEQLSAFWNQAYPRVRRLADTGAFLFSDKVNAALQDFIKDRNYESYFEDLDDNLARAQKCLSCIVEFSKADLKLKPKWWETVF